MAERRMFAKTIVDSDAFLDMPVSARLLYYDLGMRADDDGFINAPKKIMKFIGASNDDLNILFLRKFVIPFDSGVVVIKHWKIHNYIQKDRYKETVYQEEKRLLKIKDNGIYSMDTGCIHDVHTLDTQVSLGKVSLGEDSKDIYIHDALGEVACSSEIPYQEIIDHLNLKADTKYKSTSSKTRSLIDARFKEKFMLEDFIIVIDKMVSEWKGGDMEKYIRPETLFGTKFEGYLNRIETKKKSGDKNDEQRRAEEEDKPNRYNGFVL